MRARRLPAVVLLVAAVALGTGAGLGWGLAGERGQEFLVRPASTTLYASPGEHLVSPRAVAVSELARATPAVVATAPPAVRPLPAPRLQRPRAARRPSTVPRRPAARHPAPAPPATTPRPPLRPRPVAPAPSPSPRRPVPPPAPPQSKNDGPAPQDEETAFDDSG